MNSNKFVASSIGTGIMGFMFTTAYLKWFPQLTWLNALFGAVTALVVLILIIYAYRES